MASDWSGRKGVSMKGKLIVFEGPEGSGKSTQALKIFKYIRLKNKKTILLREPGGTFISEKIRAIILDPKHKNISPKTEFLLYIASRAQIIEEKIKGLLKKGFIVLLDRFILSTIVYQGYARNIDKKIIYRLNKFVLGGIRPDLTIVYDVSLNEAEKRMIKRGKKNRLDLEKKVFHAMVRLAYLKEAKKTRDCVIIKTDNKSAGQILNETVALLGKKRMI